MSQPIQYQLSLADPGAHLFHITCTIHQPDPKGQQVSLPAWIPGSYLIRDFAKHVVAMSAFQGTTQIAIHKCDKHTWQLAPCSGPVRLEYQVYAWDLSVRGAHFDTTHAFFNGTSVFVAVRGQEQSPCHLTLPAPSADWAQGWQLATGLAALPGTDYGCFGQYYAADYDELIDCPVEMGRFQRLQFAASGVPHEIVVTDALAHWDQQRLVDAVQKICESQIALFDSPAPFERYVFMLMLVGQGYGGLEHRNSTALMASRDDLPLTRERGWRDEEIQLLGLFSHEYFHSWNVKRIKPAAFVPYDLYQENYTSLLWAFEGITSYYDDYFLLRSGVIDREQYLNLVAKNITRVWRMPGRLRQSLVESSFDAWTKFYQQDENAPNAIISYYSKGAVVALALDLMIRQSTDQRHSLDQVMQGLWQQYGLTQQGVTSEGLEHLLSDVAGKDLSDFIQQALYSTEDIEVVSLLADYGVTLTWANASTKEQGGFKSPSEAAPQVHLGVRVKGETRVSISHIWAGSTAQQAGLAVGDELLALDGLQVSSSNLSQRLRAYQPGDQLQCHVFRQQRLLTFQLTLQAAPADTCYLSWVDSPSELQQHYRQAWLGE